MMTRFLFILCVLAVPVFAEEQATPTAPPVVDGRKWEQLPDMPTPVLAAAVSKVGDLAVITGGIHQFGAAQNQAQVFDLREMKWKPSIKLITGRTQHAQVALNDHLILVAGGMTGTVKPLGEGLKPTETVELIDLRTGVTRELPALPRPVPEPTGHLLPDGRAIIIGGESALVFNPVTNKWGKGIGLRADRQAHASAVLPDGKVIVVGGVNQATIEVIDPAAGISKKLAAELPHAVDDTRIAVLPDGRIWVLGGQHSGTGHTVDQTWIIDISDPRKSTISAGPKLEIPKGAADMSVVRVGPYIIYAGGESEFSGGDIELKAARMLDTRTMKVQTLPDTMHPHDDAVAIATERGVIIFGGFVESTMKLELGGVSKTMKVPQAVPAVEMLLIK